MSNPYLSAGRTERGKVRRHNEDAILMRDDIGLWAVADGLGGHTAGDYASQAVVDRLRMLSRDGDLPDFLDAIDTALQEVNVELLSLARQRGADVIGSTVVVLVHDRELLMCGWVGDSRAYAYENGGLRQITRDHVVGEKEDITQFDGRGPNPSGGALTRAIGAHAQLDIDWVLIARECNQQFLLCSDGINKEMSDEEIAGFCAREHRPEALVDRLFETALARVGRDNVSAVALRLAGNGAAVQ